MTRPVVRHRREAARSAPSLRLRRGDVPYRGEGHALRQPPKAGGSDGLFPAPSDPPTTHVGIPSASDEPPNQSKPDGVPAP